MDEPYGSLKCLCNSPQRVRILDILNGTQMDVRDLMGALDSPRSTIQRNLTKLKERDWIEETRSGYTATTVGGLLCEEFVAASETAETIKRMTPFFETVDAPPEIDLSQLTDALVMTPEPGQPTSLMTRLSAVFGEANRVRGFLPAVSSLSVELSRRADAENRRVPECEYVISSDAFAMLRQQYGTDGADGTEIDPPTHIDVRVYEGDLPYGLFVSDERFALAAYNEIGRIQTVVESTSEAVIEWGEGMYETYRRRSVRPHEAETAPVGRDAEVVE